MPRRKSYPGWSVIKLSRHFLHFFCILALGACIPNTSSVSGIPTSTGRQESTVPTGEAQPTKGATAISTNDPMSARIVRPATADILAQLGGYPCPDSTFTCVKLLLPLNHLDPGQTNKIPVVFGVLPATGERKGMFVTVTGGPGTSGLLSADSYTSAFDPSIPEHFDIVFFDQRGVGLSGNFHCPQAATGFYRSDWDSRTSIGEGNLILAAQKFSKDCTSQLDPVGSLPFYGTSQAVEDLEQFRKVMQDEKFWLYGESYGTQYAQEYAAAHPQQLAGLILDGTVDLTLTAPDFLKGQTQSFNNALVESLQNCASNPSCVSDFGGNPLAAYDRLVARLRKRIPVFAFPLPSDGFAQRVFSPVDLDTAVSGYLYTEHDRMLLLRALAAAVSRDDFIPLARLLYLSLSLNEENLVSIPDESYSDAVYYAVTCNDYNYFSGTPLERANAYLRYGDVVDQQVPRLNSIFYGDFPCVFWPVSGVANRPAPLLADTIPTLVLNARSDPATPYANGLAVYSRLKQGYLITKEGGPHIIFGRGDACPDRIVTDFLVNDQLPTAKETICPGEVVDPYVPLPPASANLFSDPLQALNSAFTEIENLPEYWSWDGATPTTIGCPQVGSLTWRSVDKGTHITLKRCGFTAGFAMSGEGDLLSADGNFSMEVHISGSASGTLKFQFKSDGSSQVSGTYNGKEINIERIEE